MFGLSRNTVEGIKKTYSRGTRIRLIQMKDSISPVSSGAVGTVDFIDDSGTIHITWDNGRTLGLIFGEDIFSIVKE